MTIQQLKKYTKEGDLYKPAPSDKVRCVACAHRCLIAEGREGVCKVRHNKGGKLMVPFGYVSALCDDPIEKKPFHHLYPGIKVMSFGMLGCNFRCDFCQNYDIAQLGGDSAERQIQTITVKEICDLAEQRGTKGICSTYNEPVITSEWAVGVFKEAKNRKFLTCSYVSNGHTTPELIEYVAPWVDSFKVDLKSFNKETYAKLGGKLDAVLDTINILYRKKIWLEIVTLVVPGLNDSDEELMQISGFISSVSPEIPWHITSFYPCYKMTDRGRTSVNTLIRARDIGKKAGLQFIYAGNLAGQVGDCENTYCNHCNTLLVERYGFQVLSNSIKSGCCYKCGKEVPGKWG